MAKELIHSHHYDHDGMDDVVDRLKSSSKYVDRLREARETAMKHGYATLRVEGHRHTLDYHSSTGRFELKKFNGKDNSDAGEGEEDLAKAA